MEAARKHKEQVEDARLRQAVDIAKVGNTLGKKPDLMKVKREIDNSFQIRLDWPSELLGQSRR